MNTKEWITAVKVLLVASALALANVAAAQSYPSKVVRLVVPYPAGGTLDALARTMAPELAKEFGQPVIVDNRAGASGMIGTFDAARADPDGYTLLMVFDAHATHPLLNKNLQYDPVKSFEPISMLIKTPMIIMAHESFAPNNLQELVAYAKANPGKVSYGSVGVGSSTHLNMEQFARETGIKMLHVPYRGGAPAMQDLIGGQFNILIGSPAFTKQGVASGKVKVLGQMGPSRSSIYPDLPTGAEQGVAPAFEALLWMGIAAPKGTPSNIIDRWQVALRKVSAIPDVSRRLRDQGLDVQLSTPEEFGQLIADDVAKWKSIVDQLGISLE